jgi:TolB-like protein
MKKSIIVLFIILIQLFLPLKSHTQESLDNAITKLAEKISQYMAEQKKTKIAVIPFQDLSNDTRTTFGKYIAEELTTALFSSGKFNIVERNLLTKVLDELKLAQTGAVDPASAKELGKITGVDAIVTGTIQDLVNRVAVNCRLIETQTGNIFAAASEKINKDETITQLINQTIETPERKREQEEVAKKKADEPKIIEYQNKTFKLTIRDVIPENMRGLYLQDLSDFLIFEVRSVTILKNKITFNMIWTNFTKETISFSKTQDEEEPFIVDKYGNKNYCIFQTLNNTLRFVPGVPVKVEFTFNNLNNDINLVDLCIQVSGKPNVVKYAVFKDLKIK